MRAAAPLTPQEVVNLVKRQVCQFEQAGLSHDAAVLMCATTIQVEPYKIAALAPPLPDAGEES
jgi:hypothetical protein